MPSRGIRCYLHPDLAGIRHEAVGHTVSRFAMSGPSATFFFSKRVAGIMLVDYANTASAAVPVYVDDEGTPARTRC